MARTNNTLTLTADELNAIIAQAVATAMGTKVTSTTKSSVGKGRKAPSTKSKTVSTKKFAFTKKDGTIAYAKSQKQLDAWTAYAERAENRERKSKEELQAITDAFKWTAKLDKAIKANPSISTKEIHELGGKGCTKQMLKARKVELKVR